MPCVDFLKYPHEEFDSYHYMQSENLIIIFDPDYNAVSFELETIF